VVAVARQKRACIEINTNISPFQPPPYICRIRTYRYSKTVIVEDFSDCTIKKVPNPDSIASLNSMQGSSEYYHTEIQGDPHISSMYIGHLVY